MVAVIKFDMREVVKLSRDLEKLPAGMKQAMGKDAARLAERMRDAIAQRAPVATGQLQASFDTTKVRSLEWQIFSFLPYAGFVDTGFRPHIIGPDTPTNFPEAANSMTFALVQNPDRFVMVRPDQKNIGFVQRGIDAALAFPENYAHFLRIQIEKFNKGEI